MGRAIIGGVIGAAVGAAIWLGVENSMGRDLPWLALLVGLLAGLGVRFCCGKDQRSFMTGTIAAVVALLGVVLGPLGNQFWLQYNFDRQAKPIVSDDALLDESESIEEDVDESEDETAAEADSAAGQSEAADDADDESAEDVESAAATEDNQSWSKPIIAAARPLLAQVTGDEQEGDEQEAGKSAIREFFETNRDLIIYAASAILAYILGSGGSKKPMAPEPSADAGGAGES